MDWAAVAAVVGAVGVIVAVIGGQTFWMTRALDDLGQRLDGRIDDVGHRVDDLGAHLGKRIDDLDRHLTERIGALERERS